jgi:hypothetical protein
MQISEVSLDFMQGIYQSQIQAEDAYDQANDNANQFLRFKI